MIKASKMSLGHPIYIPLLLLFLLSWSFATAVSLRNSNAKPSLYFGWYGYSPSAQHSWVNLGVTNNLELLQEGQRLGIPHQFYALESIYLQQGTRQGKPALVLIENWENVWEKNVPLYTSLLNNGTIDGFFMGDELMWNGLSYDQLVTWSNKVRSTFGPTVWIWENEAVPVYNCIPSKLPKPDCRQMYAPCCDMQKRPVIAPKFPPALSSTSIDMYKWLPNYPLVAHVEEFYKTYLYIRIQGNTTLFLVPGSAASHHNKFCNFSCYEDICSRDAKLFYDWAKRDEMITGMVPWTWFNCGKGCIGPQDEIGTIEMNKTIQTWQEIGRVILS